MVRPPYLLRRFSAYSNSESVSSAGRPFGTDLALSPLPTAAAHTTPAASRPITRYPIVADIVSASSLYPSKPNEEAPGADDDPYPMRFFQPGGRENCSPERQLWVGGFASRASPEGAAECARVSPLAGLGEDGRQDAPAPRPNALYVFSGARVLHSSRCWSLRGAAICPLFEKPGDVNRVSGNPNQPGTNPGTLTRFLVDGAQTACPNRGGWAALCLTGDRADSCCAAKRCFAEQDRTDQVDQGNRSDRPDQTDRGECERVCHG